MLSVVETTMVLALTDMERIIWYVALGIGAVVVVVVIALLSLLLAIVKEIDEGVEAVWRAAKKFAANTATSWQLGETAKTLREISQEARNHQAMLRKGEL